MVTAASWQVEDLSLSPGPKQAELRFQPRSLISRKSALTTGLLNIRASSPPPVFCAKPNPVEVGGYLV